MKVVVIGVSQEDAEMLSRLLQEKRYECQYAEIQARSSREYWIHRAAADEYKRVQEVVDTARRAVHKENTTK